MLRVASRLLTTLGFAVEVVPTERSVQFVHLILQGG